ncbi:hypothetical protein K502DRAFT_325823 [Neoconidiobolus thromboides FSU 785]|nr:hypothetical protein K502DRAFT_325823 [Neoconidiobolus thromboides FSU 785]
MEDYSDNEIVAVETRDIIGELQELSQLLNLDLDKESISNVLSLTEQGYNPESLATILLELKSEKRAD